MASVVVLGMGVLAGCDTLEGNITLGVGSALAIGGQAPTHEIEQIYYVGSLDPQGQLEPQMYRIRVHGQASLISQVDFASGWVQAGLIDSLGTKIKFGSKGGTAEVENGGVGNGTGPDVGRRLMQFGPEGFRTAPKDHRLVIVMGSDPSAFFQAVDSSLGEVAKVRVEQVNSKLTADLFKSLVRAQAENQRLIEIQKDAAVDLK